MKNILARGQDATLIAMTCRRVLVAFDFDGTLAPIVREPDRAAMRAQTAELLAEVARLYPCAVLSGRARADVMKKVAAIPLRAVFGNHGMEPSPRLRAWREQSAKWHAQLAAALPPLSGVVIENKGVSLAIHYRKAHARPQARARILSAVAGLRGPRVLEGKMVVNLLPAGAPDKGVALTTLCKRLRCQSAIYVGDDDNDEDVFVLAERASQRQRLLGIRIGRSRRSRAEYFVPDQAAIDRLLAKLIELRRPRAKGPARPSTGNRRREKSPRAA